MTDEPKHSNPLDGISETTERQNESPLDGIAEQGASHDKSTAEIADKWRSFMAGQDRQGTRGSSKWWVFVGTLTLFVLLGGLDHIWDTLLALVPVILFHELGHLLAMRLCGYTDLSVFFLPLFGAAATGKEVEPSHTKRAFVALMGPLPGFVLGIGLMLTTDTSEGLLNTIVQYLFLLNLFNLLPISPLDGGGIVEALVISRSTAVGKVFVFIGPAVLGLLSFALGDIALGVFAFVMFFAAAREVQLLGIIGKLRKEGIELTSGMPERVPNDVLVVLLDRLREKFKNVSDQDLATHLGLLINRLGTVKSSASATFGMMTAFAFTIVVGLGGLFASSIISTQTDPMYQGKRVSDWAAMLNLGDADGREEAEAVLRQALRESDYAIRDSTVFTIGELGQIGSAAVPLLVESLEEHLRIGGETASVQPDEVHIQRVIEAISKIGPEAATRAPNVPHVLAAALSHPAWAIRHAATIGLNAIGPTAILVFPQLKQAFAAEQDSYVKEAMQYSMLQLTQYITESTSPSRADAGPATTGTDQ